MPNVIKLLRRIRIKHLKVLGEYAKNICHIWRLIKLTLSRLIFDPKPKKLQIVNGHSIHDRIGVEGGGDGRDSAPHLYFSPGLHDHQLSGLFFGSYRSCPLGNTARLSLSLFSLYVLSLAYSFNPYSWLTL